METMGMMNMAWVLDMLYVSILRDTLLTPHPHPAGYQVQAKRGMIFGYDTRMIVIRALKSYGRSFLGPLWAGKRDMLDCILKMRGHEKNVAK